jgi:hypothetical protein
MVKYPIHVERDGYRGRDPRKLRKSQDYNDDARMLEEFVNREIEENGPGQFLYGTIARAVGLSKERVQQIMFSVDCGHNGFVVSHGVGGLPADFVKVTGGE